MSFTIGQPQQSGSDVILSQLGQGLGGGIQQGLQNQLASFNNQKQKVNLKKDLIARNVPEYLADVIVSGTTGAKTKAYENYLDMVESGEIDPRRVNSIYRNKSPHQNDELDNSQSDISFTDKQNDKIEFPDGKEEDIEDISEVDFKEATKGMNRKQRQQYMRDWNQRSFELNKKYLNKLAEISADLPKESVAITQMREAMDSGDLNSWRNKLADITGQEWLKTASAQELNTATKQYVMSSLSSMTGRPNQTIERMLALASVSPQYQDEANEVIWEGIKGLHDLKKEEVKLSNSISNQFYSKGKELPRNFQNIIATQMKKKAEKFENDYERKVKSLLGNMEIPEGTEAANDEGKVLVFKGGKWREK